MRLSGGLLIAGLLASAASARPADVTVQLLAINDLHGHLEPPAGEDGLVGGVPAGGIAYLAAHLKRAAQGRPNTLVVGAGDMVGASPFLSAYFDEVPTIAALNALHLAVTSIGNHELDDGAAGLRRRLAGRCLAGRDCARPAYRYLAANVQADGAPLLPATAVYRIGGVRVGFIGATDPATATMLTATAAKGLAILDPADTVNAAARRLEAQGVHAIVLLIHSGGRQTAEGGGAVDPNGCAGLRGDLLPILPRLSPSIGIVLSAHTHRAYNCTIDGRLVTSADAFGRMFTRVTLAIDPATDRIVRTAATNVVATRDVPPDPAEASLLARYRPRAEMVSGRIVGTASAPILRTPDGGESPLGDFIADAMLAAGPVPADIAFMNPGGIRADIVPDAQGRISFGTLYEVQPFGNRLMTATMTGDAVRRLLEQQLERGPSHLLPVSAGFTYRYRADAPAGRHVEPGSILLHGQPLAPDARVRIRVNEFLLAGGEGLTVFREASDVVAGGTDRDALVAYVAARSPVAPGSATRIVRVDMPATQAR